MNLLSGSNTSSFFLRQLDCTSPVQDHSHRLDETYRKQVFRSASAEVQYINVP